MTARFAAALSRKAVKAAVLPIGIPGRRRPGDLVILGYHRVGVGEREIDVPLRAFEKHVSLLASRERVSVLEEAIEDGSGGVVLTFDDGYRDFHEHVLPVLVRHRVPALLYLATGLVANGHAEPNDPAALTWGMLAEAISTGLVSIGSHTHGHVELSTASEAEAGEEMRHSKELVEDRLGVACRHFAYPWGRGSSGADRAARRLFDTAALDAWATNRAGAILPHRLGRTPILRSDGVTFFRAKVRGLLDPERLAYRALRRGPWGAPPRSDAAAEPRPSVGGAG